VAGDSQSGSGVNAEVSPMRSVIYSMGLSLDGFIAGPGIRFLDDIKFFI
jgi:hypothetical protein